MIPPPAAGGASPRNLDNMPLHDERWPGTAEAGRTQLWHAAAGPGPHIAGLQKVVG